MENGENNPSDPNHLEKVGWPSKGKKRPMFTPKSFRPNEECLHNNYKFWDLRKTSWETKNNGNRGTASL